ncbi:uncharacterized protein LOC108194200 isoform X2 [Daucus carota subsp. sativus]|uniref:uncharacterized protein LOC108194200 isoform X2 n=1 Tax=Daucus carota subsp. sativus TaxID=79200 RepID=UPI0007B1B042|nr:PREDICTED: uncharacterized protein LOC108194200 [Daucus carota subsp. sativus]
MATKGAPTSNKSDPTYSLQSQEQRSLNDALRKANGILHGGSGALNSFLLSMLALENNDEADASMSIRNPREKRPALGHKPAQFSLRPNISQASADFKVNLNIDQLHDPVDFFPAYDPKDEMQRHKDGSIYKINDSILSENPRSRQPGILGKSVSYKHHYSSAVSENDDNFLSSQEAIQEDSLCPSKFVWQQETAHSDIDLQGKEVVESIPKTEKRISEILDKLLSESIEILDGDGAPSSMQEGLQTKPVNVDKYLPDFSCTGRSIIALEKEFPQNRILQTDAPKLIRGLSGKSPIKSKNVAENPVHNLASSTTPKSPFAALSLLNKHISQLKPNSDPFVDLDIDLSSARNASSVEEFNRLSQKVDEGKGLIISSKLTSPTEVEATRTAVNGQSDSTLTKGLLMNGQPIAADSTFGKDLKQRNKAPRKGSAKGKSKATHEQKRRKAIPRQKTGRCLESGIRHSKRIRTRPLAYWKGERFLYGRVHESLATVIGIKYMSTAEESGQPTFRVSSYVSDEHKELVELAAMH